MSRAREQIGPALGKIVSGLYIATARLHGQPVGMLCSFVDQAGFDPPMITLAISPERPLSPALEVGGVFGLHVLGKGNQALLKSFVNGGTPESFEGHELVENEHGVPQFAEAWAFLIGRVRERMLAGDHVLHLAEVIAGALQNTGREEPMVRVRPNGFTY